MERTVTGAAEAASPPPAPLPGDTAAVPARTVAVPAGTVAGLLGGLPRQRGVTAPMPTPTPTPTPTPPPTQASVPAEARPAARAARWWRLLPTPAGTPFTFAYVAVLAVTSTVASLADPHIVHTLHQGSSTDVAHLLHAPAPVLLASALWIAGGVVSPYALALVLVLTALERRIGGTGTACVFLAGHVLATLATEVPVGLAVLSGHLPQTSLHRLDYGVSFGVAASIGALAGLLGPWLRRPLLVLFGGVLVRNLIAFTDPVTDWGHLISLAIGVGTWPLVRRRQRCRTA
ncbi:hypothetical protein GCM10010503_07000 [Streptomyces lucensis JCM 4490]|uniref:Uncharacterized protein n=1 Tax=Streptomyces lucensis JCM 4490 TaxID=1306176 RepID=A0A918MKK0_9ACTN|nr:rhomboid-like protein [Streptomyces lucensis]GGW33567.1 hypothetical protein GCM10010503_07000 [Streptomyces lucensis JCM 4490]